MKPTRANVTKILTAAGFILSEESQSGRKFRVMGKSQSICVASEGFTIRVLHLSNRVETYVTYTYNTMRCPSPAQVERGRALEAQAHELLAKTFDMHRDSGGAYFTQAN